MTRIAHSMNKKMFTPLFTGRQDILQQMDDFFRPRDPASSPRRDFWLWGIGGVGKTQIALRFMAEFKDRYVDAESDLPVREGSGMLSLVR